MAAKREEYRSARCETSNGSEALGEERSSTITARARQSEWRGGQRLARLGREWEERAAAPHPLALAGRIVGGERRELVIDRAGEPRLQAVAHKNERGKASGWSALEAERVLAPRFHRVVHIGAEGKALPLSPPLPPHLHGDEGHRFDRDRHLLDRRDQVVAPGLLAAEHRGEELDEPLPSDGAPLVVPRAVAADLQPDIPAKIKLWQCSGRPFAAGLCRCYDSIALALAGHG